MSDLPGETMTYHENGNRFTPTNTSMGTGSATAPCNRDIAAIAEEAHQEISAAFMPSSTHDDAANSLDADSQQGTSATGHSAAAATRTHMAASTPTDLSCDVVIVGCGVAGLYCALNLPRSLSVIMLAKTTVDECDSMLAQGGICMQHDADDYAPFFEDTLRAGHFENRCESVDLMIRASRSVIEDLVAHGVDFERDEAGQLRYTREGAHSRARICFHDDTTGAEITEKLLAAVRELPNVRILEHTCMDDIMVESAASNEENHQVNGKKSPAQRGNARCDANAHNRGNEYCSGILAHDATGRAIRIAAQATVWATGGIGGTYARSTNFPSLTGDALRIARAHGIALEHTDYVQIHPTSLYTNKPGRAFLISESCRGEGAVLINAHGNRFTDELQPRDVVSAAIYRQMEHEGTDHERLSFAPVPKDEVTGHFQHIYEHCLAEGFDITREPIPVVPAQHYFMGGVHVDRNSATTMRQLYAAGETSCNGVHGKNRLASNSLLESLVFAQRAAWDIARTFGLAAPHPQTYTEQPTGADAEAYERLCAQVAAKAATAASQQPQSNNKQSAARKVESNLARETAPHVEAGRDYRTPRPAAQTANLAHSPAAYKEAVSA